MVVVITLLTRQNSQSSQPKPETEPYKSENHERYRRSTVHPRDIGEKIGIPATFRSRTALQSILVTIKPKNEIQGTKNCIYHENSVEEYQGVFPERTVPDRRVFSNVHRNLRGSGKFPQQRRERPLQRNVDLEDNILEMDERSPTTSVRRISGQVGDIRV
jgi:hypothetical protein